MPRVVRPTKALDGANELDMRVSDKLGLELREEIIDSVAHTQAFIQQELPNLLVLNQAQFDSLVGYTDEMFGTQDRIFATPLNVMEVEVRTDHDESTTADDDLERFTKDLNEKIDKGEI